MEILPLLQSISTGVPWLDHAVRIIGIAYLLYSVFLNVLVQVSPDAKDWNWVRMSLAMVANINALLNRNRPAETPPDRGMAIPPAAKVPSFEAPTRPDATRPLHVVPPSDPDATRKLPPYGTE